MRFRFLLLPLLGFGCARPGPPPPPYDPPRPSPVGVGWRLAELGGAPARGVAGPIPTLLLQTDGRVTGNTGCSG